MNLMVERPGKAAHVVWHHATSSSGAHETGHSSSVFKSIKASVWKTQSKGMILYREHLDAMKSFLNMVLVMVLSLSVIFTAPVIFNRGVSIPACTTMVFFAGLIICVCAANVCLFSTSMQNNFFVAVVTGLMQYTEILPFLALIRPLAFVVCSLK
jgi:hypothetical protein